ncbi:MAG: DNA (cytosine-5-)-methyltransferase [Flavobacteriales bacterium]|nr:DNA (cytosine-5-)-methyltransferase [Flavobacteriales bacterium]MCB9168256.1 DNA (cytosine-5-)-methyltransferase [Flavobacteriales bacterium]
MARSIRKQEPYRAIRVVELFAGVGGFRIGLDRAGSKVPDAGFEVVLSDQWEPGRRRQLASEVYVARFGAEGHLNIDISDLSARDLPPYDLLVAGFPCQDYSVASTLANSKGMLGKKGVLWWQIHRILRDAGTRPGYLLLENVDRLLGSPATQRGRDLAVMLASLRDLGYAVEWRVINAADYGMPQRRRRVFIMGYHRSTPEYALFAAAKGAATSLGIGAVGRAFPFELVPDTSNRIELDTDLVRLSKEFNRVGGRSPFLSAGTMIDGRVFTQKVKPVHRGKRLLLGDLLQPDAEVPKDFFLERAAIARWRYLKGAKKEPRKGRGNEFIYHYAEGAMVFPDPKDRPARTIVTGEGGRAPSRFKHVVRGDSGRLRRLTPVELERLNMFPDGHTEGASDAWRAFFMGNALVVGIVERIGRELLRLTSGRGRLLGTDPAKRR